MKTFLQCKRSSFACFQTSKHVSGLLVDREYRLVTTQTLEYPPMWRDIAMEDQGHTINRDISSRQEEINIY